MPDPSACPPLDRRPWPPPPCGEYALRGPQVEPAASYWTEDSYGCPVPPCVVTIGDILAAGCAPAHYPTAAAEIAAEIQELVDLASLRDEPGAVVSTVQGWERRRISPFLHLDPQPLGAVFNRERARHRCGERCTGGCERRCEHRPDDEEVPVIRTGRELARYFESETPGLAHRQALNYLLRDTNWSPPRQARVWMALDVTIYSALAAAWYFKWRHPGGVSRRPRPIECDRRVSVLFNRAVDDDGDADGVRRLAPDPSPGTPRHPAYPSGHSTYAAAASELLSYFFPDYAAEFDDLADNAGMARLWAGIHWRSDHTAGAALGRCVARLVIAQLQDGCITAPPSPCDPPDPCAMPPSQEFLDDCASACCTDEEAAAAPGRRAAGRGSRHPAPSPEASGRARGGRRDLPSSATVEQAEGPQEGAAATSAGADERARARGPQEGAPAHSSDAATIERARGPQKGAG